MIDLIRKLGRLLTPREKFHARLLLGAMLLGSLLEMLGVGAIPAFVSVLTNPDAIQHYPAGRRLLQVLGITTPAQLVLGGSAALLLLFVVKNCYLVVLSWL